MAYNSSHTGAQIDSAVGAVREKESTWDGKQDALTGKKGQFVGFTADNTPGAVDAPSSAIPTALKNPYALTIKIGSTTVTYDGSSAETVEIADGTEVSY